ncbi:DUF1192 family protein [Thermaurantiacus sp.]
MSDPDDRPTPRPDDPLRQLAAEDLDRLSLAELDRRAEALAAELERTRARREAASRFRAAADALFGKR